MSNYGQERDGRQPDPRGPEAFLSQEERKQLSRMLGFPEDLPSEFKEWLPDFLAINFPQIPITQVSGFEKYLYRKGTELPADPKDGQRYTYIADATNGISWEFRYNESSGSTYKWEFAGGPPIAVEVSAEVSTTAGGYVALAGGPSTTVPLAGDYLVQHGTCQDQTNDDSDVRASIYNGSTDGLVIEGEGIVYGPGGHRLSASRAGILNMASANGTFEQRYSVGSGTGVYRNRWLIVQPVRVKRA